jgi:replicative DNA helicase
MRRLVCPGKVLASEQANHKRVEQAPSPLPPRAEPVRIPHDPVNEQILLAAAVLDRETRERLVARVSPDAFLVREHVEAWQALTELARRKLDFDSATLQQLSGGRVDGAYLMRLAADRVDVPQNLDHHIAMLEWDRVRIEAVRGPLASLLDALKDPITPPERVRLFAKQLAASLEHGTTSSLLREPMALVQSTMTELRMRRDRACYPYGIPGLDMQDDRQRWRMIPGAAPGKITVVTGVPGSGKSTFVARVALAQAEAGRRVAYGAWEMGDENTLELLAAMRLGWSRYALSTGAITEEQELQLAEEMERLGQYIRFVAVPGAPKVTGSHVARGDRATNERALDQIHAVLSDMGADVFIADLWKRCLRQIEPDDEEQALVRQQAIASETRVHCILIQQQRLKDIEQRPDKRPTREGIKGSAAWVEVADTIIGTHRQALWKNSTDDTFELDVLKQRWGTWPMAIEFDWDSDKGSITGGVTVRYDPEEEGMFSNGPSGFLAPSVQGSRQRSSSKAKSSKNKAKNDDE